MTLELRLLGTPVVLCDGQELALATRKALALLAYLALEGQTARGVLANALWSEMSEDAARTNLRKEVFRLRETPLREALTVSSSSLELSPDVIVDAKRFLALGAANDEAALELYSGALLEGVELNGAAGFEAWLDGQRERLQETCDRLLRGRATRLEMLGDLRGALSAQRTLLATDELRESQHREVMRLHWQLGERAAALEQFDALAELLSRELGLTPLPETLALLAKIQRGGPDESTAPEPARSKAPNLSHPPLIGRESAWQWLESRGAGLNLILGEVGVGKTRLCEDALEPVLTLRGFESASATPLYPVAEALRAALPRLQSLDDLWRLEVARLLPELLRPGERESVGQNDDGRARFLEGLTKGLQLSLPPGGALLLDDLHWFDASSLEFVAHLVRRAPELRVVATARSLELSENAAAQNVLNALEREGLIARLTLNPLGEAQTLSLLQALSGGAARLFARRLQNATGGNPLFALETLRGLFESGALHTDADGSWVTPFDNDTEDYTELPIPPNVLELALGRVTHLGGAVRRLLEVAVLSGEPFEADDLMPATALSDWEGLEALERALGGQVVRHEGQAYRFSHDVLRQSLLNQLSLERQRLIHRRLADSLGKRDAAPARVAQHLELGGRELEAAPWHLSAARQAQTVYAHQDARRHYGRALELTRDPRVAFRTHAALAELELTLLQLDALEAHSQSMLEIAEGLSDATLTTEARLMRAKARLYRGQYKDALEEARVTAESATGDLLPEALAILGTALIGCGQLQEAEPHLQRVLQTAKPRSPLIGETHAILKELYRQQGDLARALEQAELARDAHKALGKLESELTMQAQVGQILGLLGRSEEALERLRDSADEARAMGFERVLTVSLLLSAEAQTRAGLWDEAESTALEGLSLTESKVLARECQFVGILARIQQYTGRLDAAIETSKKALELSKKLKLPIQSALANFTLIDIYLETGNESLTQIPLKELDDLILNYSQVAFILPLETRLAQLDLLRGEPENAILRLEKISQKVSNVLNEYEIQLQVTLAEAYAKVERPNSALKILETLPLSYSWLEKRIKRLWDSLEADSQTERRP